MGDRGIKVEKWNQAYGERKGTGEGKMKDEISSIPDCFF